MKMETKKLTLQGHSSFHGWLEADEVHESKKTLEEILTEQLFSIGRMHCPFYEQLHTFERNYISLMVRKALEN
jgi:hypothetical protein